MTFHGTFKTKAASDAAYIHSFAFLKSSNFHFSAYFEITAVKTDFTQILGRLSFGLFKVGGHGLVNAAFLSFIEPDLIGVVAVGFFSLDLNYLAGAGFYDGHGHNFAVVAKDAHHAQFFSEYFFHLVYQVFISTSTPAGKSNFIKASTVAGVES